MRPSMIKCSGYLVLIILCCSDLSFNNLTGQIPTSISKLYLDFMYFTGNMLTGSIPGRSPASALTFGSFSYNYFTNVSFAGPNNDTNVSSPLELMDAYCPLKKSKYNSLYINCGGGSKVIEGNYYEEDNEILAFYVSPKGSWAYSRSGDIATSVSSPGDYIRTTAGRISVRDAPLYATSRLSPVSLKYYGLCLHNGNYSVKLHFAEIIYTDDKDYSSLGKRVFDVYIQGERVLKDFNIIDVAGGANKVTVENYTAVVKNHLLEIHFYWAGKGSTYIPPRLYGPLISAISVTPDFKTDSGKISASRITIIAVASVSFFLLVLASIWKMGWLGRKGLHHDEFRGLELQGSFFSFHQIKAATQNFSSENKIGEGGFGAVYKGILPNGMEIAVKQLSSLSKQGTHEFVTEVGTMTSLSHPNLVKLLGCCTEDNQLLLIYEYMENNSLAHALFGSGASKMKLDWPTRRKICLGIAKGLAFLHSESRIKIIHRDIKATNVLLDRDLNAKISDFGLAKLNEEEHTLIVTRIAGTHGYMAPEYAMRGILTDKADVYSFGVVTLEIVSGKYNAENRPNHEIAFLLDRAYVLREEGKLIELVDPVLGSNFRVEEAIRILDLAMLCTNPSPTLRPSMLEVVSILEGKKTTEKAPSLSRPYSSDNSERAETLADISLSTHPASTSTERTSELISSYMSRRERWETEYISVDGSNEISEETAAMLKTS